MKQERFPRFDRSAVIFYSGLERPRIGHEEADVLLMDSEMRAGPLSEEEEVSARAMKPTREGACAPHFKSLPAFLLSSFKTSKCPVDRDEEI